MIIDPRLEKSITKPVLYTVRLHFCDPDNDRPGQRVFNVAIVGQDRDPELDIVALAGGRDRPSVRTYTGVEVRGKLVIRFTPSDEEAAADPARAPLVCGVEVVRESP